MVERLTAIKCAIGELLNGNYKVKEGSLPSFVETVRGNVSRVNVIAAVVGKPSPSSLHIDDGSGTIETRSFDTEELFGNVLVGDILLLIGRPREYQGKRYLVAEIAKRLGTPTWLKLRKAELGEIAQPPKEKVPIPKKEVLEERTEKKPDTPLINQTDAILALIKKLDDGSGVPIETVIEESENVEAESILTTLMAEGEIFEIRPGRVKVLE